MAWEMFLRGAVAALLLFHVCHLALPGARPAARGALIVFTLSVLAYLFCQQADVLQSLPRALVYLMLALCVSSTAWMWIAARALFDDHFVLSAPIVGAGLALAILGLAANVAHLPEAAAAFPDSALPWLAAAHGTTMLAFATAALWEIGRGWSDDLVEPRRVARRWVALGIGLYAAIALVIELVLRGQAIGRLLPTLHVAGIGAVTLALAVLVARRSLDEVLGIDAPATAPAPLAAGSAALVPPRPHPAVARLKRAMNEERVYRREGLTLADLATTLGMGEAALRRLINGELGYRNFNDFLHHYRLKDAAGRLAAEDLPILTIALESGYGSIGSFNRAFRQRYGMTPSTYRGASRLTKGSATN